MFRAADFGNADRVFAKTMIRVTKIRGSTALSHFINTQPMNDRFYYGHRQNVVYDKTGQPSYTYAALTVADFLNPQPEDEFAHGIRHALDVRTLRRIFRHVYRYNPFMTVLSQVKMIWETKTLPQPAPDVAVIPNVTEPDQTRTVFDVQSEETRPRFVLEVVSPRLAEADLQDKVAIYQQAGVTEYFVLDSGLRPENENAETAAYTVLGYRLENGVYQPIAPDARGWLFSKTTKTWFGVTPERDNFFVNDERTGQPIVPDSEQDESSAAANAEAVFRAHSIAAQLKLGE